MFLEQIPYFIFYRKRENGDNLQKKFKHPFLEIEFENKHKTR